VALSGAATVRQLNSNLTALELREPELVDNLVEDPETYWEKRSALPWN
jgi:hypothetical protein